MSYEKLSSITPGSSGNASEKQGPKGLPAPAFGKAIAPAANIIQERASYVIVNGGNATAYAFLYETTCSLGGTTGETYTVGFDYTSTTQNPIKLEINPVSWNGGAAGVGEVTFVYKGGI